MSSVVIVDYGLGNLFSVVEALTHIGASVHCSSSPSDILKADKVILPGVGAFADGMAGIQSKGLQEPLREYARSGRPLLGICLGMQMLFHTSHEFGVHSGLGILEGEIQPIPNRDTSGNPLRIPHMGWNSVHPGKGPGTELGTGSWNGTILEHITPGTCFYFAHSFAYMELGSLPVSKLGVVFHGGHLLTAVTQYNNVLGVQFHPERSGSAGLKLLEAFLSLPSQSS
jgi:glutamine amidotransferase